MQCSAAVSPCYVVPALVQASKWNALEVLVSTRRQFTQYEKPGYDTR